MDANPIKTVRAADVPLSSMPERMAAYRRGECPDCGTALESCLASDLTPLGGNLAAKRCPAADCAYWAIGGN